MSQKVSISVTSITLILCPNRSPHVTTVYLVYLMAQAEDSFCAPDAVTRQVDENFNDFAFAGADAMKSATEQRDTLTR